MSIDKTLPLLIVDDNLQIRSAIRSILADLGFADIHQAASGEEACRILLDKPIAAILCDSEMPGMSGMELLAWTRANVSHRSAPFMLLSGDADPDTIRATLAEGVSEYLVKPFTFDSFNAKLHALFEPLRRAAPPARAPSAPRLIGLEAPAEERIRNATVLVVDDIATNIKVIAGMLADDGYSIKVAVSGKKALEIASASKPDLILLDVMMPEMDGFEVCRRLKADPATAPIPVIFLSAKDQAEDIVGGLELGAVDYVTKPVDSVILKARMRTHLRLAAMMADLRRQNAIVADHAALRGDVERVMRCDLGAPLAALVASSERLLAQTPDAAALRAGLRELAGAARSALRLVNLSTELYRLENGISRPYSEPLMLGEVLAPIAAAAIAADPARAIELPKTTLSVQGDRQLCHGLFDLLLRHAADSAPVGTPLVVGGLLDAEFCVVTVGYAGDIPIAVRARCHDKHAAGPDSDDSTLALYAARVMAESQGGSLQLSDHSEHTVLTVRLPRGAV